MPFYKRGFLYLIRKRIKSVLLLFIFLFVCTMILGTTMILHAVQRTQADMEEKTNSKIVCEITDTNAPITQADTQAMAQLPYVQTLNRMGDQTASLCDHIPVTASTSSQPENARVRVLSFDDLSNDSPFSDGSYRLIQGQMITPETTDSAVVNEIFAQTNQLYIGDTLSLENDAGEKVSLTITGLYLAGNETRQDSETLAAYRLENQIFIDNHAYTRLFGDQGFFKVSVYTSQPKLIHDLAKDLETLLADKAEITASDALFQQMSVPLNQIARIVGLMRLLTFLAGTLIVSLILCMWMRSRQREMAVLISMGEGKIYLFLQALLESALIFLLAAAASCILGSLGANFLENAALASVSTDVSLNVSLQQQDIAQLLSITGIVVIIAVFLSLLPVLRANPKDILSRMEG